MQRGSNRSRYLILGVIAFMAVIIVQLVRIQLIDQSYKVSAQNNALYYQTRYPARGRILDRNREVIVGNKSTYDILVTPIFVKDFDTLALCSVFSIEPDEVRETFKRYRMYRSKIGYRTVTFLKQVSQEQYTLFLENHHKFPQFLGVAHTTRSYPFNAGGNLLGYVTETDPNYLNKHTEYSTVGTTYCYTKDYP